MTQIECKDCPHRKHYNDGHWSTELCDHPRAPGVYENHIKGHAYDNTLVTPEWCPKRNSECVLQTITDTETLEVENRMMRERNERLEAECVTLKEERDVAIRAYRELLVFNKQTGVTK
jgi:hypothetical protein